MKLMVSSALTLLGVFHLQYFIQASGAIHRRIENLSTSLDQKLNELYNTSSSNSRVRSNISQQRYLSHNRNAIRTTKKQSKIIRLDLYNAVTDTKIGSVTNGSVIALSQYGLNSPTQLNIEAVLDSSGGSEGSVFLQASGSSSFTWIDEQIPFTACGNTGSSYNGCTKLNLGQTTLSATYYTGSSLTGSSSIPYTVDFTIVSQHLIKPPTKVPIQKVNVKPTSVGSISRIEIVNADTDVKLGTLVNGSTLVMSQLGIDTPTKLNFDAIVEQGKSVGSVVFDARGSSNFQKTEGGAPYAACGNNELDFFLCTQLGFGTTTIVVTPFSGGGGTGLAGKQYSITCTIISSPTVSPMVVVKKPSRRKPRKPVTKIPSSAPNVPTNNPKPTIPGKYNYSRQGEITGELKKWHKITLGFTGPSTSESSTPNPFTYYRLDVTFTHIASGSKVVVPGFYAADGNAANTGATSGSVWLVHFSPSQIGSFRWSASFTMGENVAQLGGGVSAGFFDNVTGSFTVTATDKTGRDHRGKGRLQYIKEHYLRFAENKEYFLKAGVDSPENFFAYDDFDNTPNNGGYRKSWAPHVQDYVSGDPLWARDKGKGIIGAINYLSNKGLVAFSFLTFNVKGDDKNVFMYVSDTDFTRIDVSKTGQWEIVLEHADRMGMYLHFKTQENENCKLLDNGDLGLNRKLYYRELIARFGHHLALNWNLGEEDVTSDAQRKTWVDFISAVDPYKSPIVLHTFPGRQDSSYTPLLNYQGFTGVSLQTSQTADETYKWVTKSAAANYRWIVAVDESGGADDGVKPDVNDATHDWNRRTQLYANIMNGGAGVEYYFGYSFPNSDLTCQDFRSRSNMWDQSRFVLEFFRNNKIPFWQMAPSKTLITPSNANWALATADRRTVLVYLSNGGTTSINLSPAALSGLVLSVGWFDPLLGGQIQTGSIQSIASGGSSIPLGNPPSKQSQDWLILLRKL